MKTGIIYKHTNKINGKSYIGLTTRSMEERLKQHLKSAENGDKFKFQRAIRKYGIENFSSEIIENNIPLYSIISEKINILSKREIYWINYYDTYNNGYNMTKGGEGTTGVKYTEERRQKVIKSNTNRIISEETKLKISKARKGTKLSEETIKKITAIHKGKKISEETKLKMSNSSKDRKIIDIFNSNNEIIYTSTKNFKKFCKEKNLPSGLANSYRNNGRPYKGFKYKQYIGWYAKIRIEE